MTQEPTPAERIRHLPHVMAFDALNSVFCRLTVFGSVFVLFLSDLGLDKARIGVVLSLIPFAGIGAIFLAPLAAGWGSSGCSWPSGRRGTSSSPALLATPLVATRRWGVDGAFVFVAAMTAGFSLCRAFGEAANAQWRQDIIPHQLRGRFSAVDNIVATLAGVAAVFVSGWVIAPMEQPLAVRLADGRRGGRGTGVDLLGLADPRRAWRPEAGKPAVWHLRRFAKALSDRNFLTYLTALSLVTVGSVPLNVFVPAVPHRGRRPERRHGGPAPERVRSWACCCRATCGVGRLTASAASR